jgi:hypothetical protein
MKRLVKNIYTILLSIVLVLAFSCEEKTQDADHAKVAAVDTTLKWTHYHIGEPPPDGYYAAFDSVIKRWNIRYERIDGGCEELPEERARYEKDNPKYFKILDKRFGKNWLQRFHAEVKALDSTLKKDNKLYNANDL